MRWLLVAIVAVLAVGCGTDEKAGSDSVRGEIAKFQPLRKCTSVSRGFRACSTFFARDRKSAIYRRDGEQWRKVIGSPPRAHGWWRRVLPAPDRRTLLAQWSGACEIQSTYMISAATGTARPIFDHQESHALGWRSTRARVAVPNSSSYATDGGRPFAAGIYLVHPQTLALRLERPLPDRNGC